jgi:hypothetical protein
MLDEEVLEEATRTLGQKTYLATINFALKIGRRERRSGDKPFECPSC